MDGGPLVKSYKKSVKIDIIFENLFINKKYMFSVKPIKKLGWLIATSLAAAESAAAESAANGVGCRRCCSAACARDAHRAKKQWTTSAP